MTKTELKTKLENIWYHYKTHILVGIFIVIALIPMLFLDKGEKPSGLNVALIGSSINPAQHEKLQRKATNAMFTKHSKLEIKIDLWKLNGSVTSSVNTALNQKLMAQIGTNDIDVMIMNKNDFLLFEKKGAFVNLEDNQELSDIINNKSLQPVSYAGIDITENKLLSDAGFDTHNKVLGIVSNSKHKKKAFQFVKWLTSQQ